MQFALVNCRRYEPQPKLSGQCPNCEAEMISKCGKINVWHWSHKGKLVCDPWWENESEWHRNWKNKFPKDWQEIIHKSENGEKHIADVKTDQSWVIELQHSPISQEERQSRNNFYKRIAWVVDGTRRKKDLEKFYETIAHYNSIFTDVDLRRVNFEGNALLKEWADSGASIFFDFHRTNPSEEEFLWWLLPIKDGSWAYILNFSRANFIKLHHDDKATGATNFEDTLRHYIKVVVNRHNSILQQNVQREQTMRLQMIHTMQPRQFQQHLAQRRIGKQKVRF